MQITALLHASFLVADVTKAKMFYERTLGLMPSDARPDLGFPGVWYNIEPHQQLHLMQLPNPEIGLSRPTHGGSDRHVALGVASLGELIERLQQAGVPFTLSKSGRRALFCRDPDNNALEFIETPAP